MIVPSQSKTYAEVIDLIPSGANSEVSQVEVRAISQTGSRRVLLELVKKSQEKTVFCDTLKAIFGSNVTVRKLEPKENFVTEAIKRKDGDLVGDLNVIVTGVK